MKIPCTFERSENFTQVNRQNNWKIGATIPAERRVGAVAALVFIILTDDIWLNDLRTIVITKTCSNQFLPAAHSNNIRNSKSFHSKFDVRGVQPPASKQSLSTKKWNF